jgi:hypothetical protein
MQAGPSCYLIRFVNRYQAGIVDQKKLMKRISSKTSPRTQKRQTMFMLEAFS